MVVVWVADSVVVSVAVLVVAWAVGSAVVSVAVLVVVWAVDLAVESAAVKVAGSAADSAHRFYRAPTVSLWAGLPKRLYPRPHKLIG